MANKNQRASFFLNDSNVSKDFFGDQIESTEDEIITKISADPNNPETFPKGFVDKNKFDTTTEVQIRLHKKEDDEQAKLDALNKNA